MKAHPYFADRPSSTPILVFGTKEPSYAFFWFDTNKIPTFPSISEEDISVILSGCPVGIDFLGYVGEQDILPDFERLDGDFTYDTPPFVVFTFKLNFPILSNVLFYQKDEPQKLFTLSSNHKYLDLSSGEYGAVGYSLAEIAPGSVQAQYYCTVLFPRMCPPNFELRQPSIFFTSPPVVSLWMMGPDVPIFNTGWLDLADHGVKPLFNYQDPIPRPIDPHHSLPQVRNSIVLKQQPLDSFKVCSSSLLYYHYSQDPIQDVGWACAYRSLQTVASAIIRAGFGKGHDVPGVHDIQRILFEIGACQANILESRTWIGSIEVSFVLNHLFDVETEIITARNLEELQHLTANIASYFETGLSFPLMIGGSKYAHTIVGADATTQQYAILDPHYVGNDSVKSILRKGCIVVNPLSFFDEGYTYNMVKIRIKQ
ncbi:hypothetical protein PCE1_000090 [Barthelona sp. PCE]